MITLERLLAETGQAPPVDMASAERRHRMWRELHDLSARIADFVQRWWEMDPELRNCHKSPRPNAAQLELPFVSRSDDELPF